MKVRIPAWLLSVACLVALPSITAEWPIHVRAQGTGQRAAGERRESSKPSDARTLRLPAVPYRYADLELPAHFTRETAQHFDNTPTDNAVTDQGATLGRALFYDTRLS